MTDLTDTADVAHRDVPGHSGLPLRLYDWGGTGPALLFLHGYANDSRVWDDFVPGLLDHHHVLGLDACGHGGSANDPEYRYHQGVFGKDVKAALDHEGISRVTLVAHSMLGHACIGLAARYSDLVERLVLVDAGAELPTRSMAGKRSEDERARGEYASVAEFERVLAADYPRARADLLARLARLWLRELPGGRYQPRFDPGFFVPRSKSDKPGKREFKRAAWAEAAEAALWQDLARIHCETLIMRGSESIMLSQHTVERMVEEVLPHGSAVEIPRAGHAVMIENPEDFRTALETFLLGIEASPP